MVHEMHVVQDVGLLKEFCILHNLPYNLEKWE